MSAAAATGTEGDVPRAAPPVSTGAAALLLVAAVAVAALVSTSVARLVPPVDEDRLVESRRPVPAEPAGADVLDGVAPLVTFDGPDGPLAGRDPVDWSIAAGAWTVEGGAARPTDPGEEGAIAVAAAPAGADVAQVTLRDPEPGAGLVVSYRDPQHFVALQVSRAGSTVQLVEVDGRPLQPRALVSAELVDPDAPLVLAVRHDRGIYEAVANGVRIGRRRIEGEPGAPWRIGLLSGARPTATATTFDDVVVAET